MIREQDVVVFQGCGDERSALGPSISHPVYDMQGNVNEWCIDHIGKQEPKEVPFGQFGCDRVVKGGHYDSIPELCHPSITYSQCSSFGGSTIGFRICRY